jgi:hypothetical protein
MLALVACLGLAVGGKKDCEGVSYSPVGGPKLWGSTRDLWNFSALRAAAWNIYLPSYCSMNYRTFVTFKLQIIGLMKTLKVFGLERFD